MPKVSKHLRTCFKQNLKPFPLLKSIIDSLLDALNPHNQKKQFLPLWSFFAQLRT